MAAEKGKELRLLRGRDRGHGSVSRRPLAQRSRAHHRAQRRLLGREGKARSGDLSSHSGSSVADYRARVRGRPCHHPHPSARFSPARKRLQSEHHKTLSIGAQQFRFHCKREPFTDPRVRQAIAYAIDRRAIIDNLMPGMVEPSTGPLTPRMRGRADLGEFPYDPEKAKALLAEAGYPDGFETNGCAPVSKSTAWARSENVRFLERLPPASTARRCEQNDRGEENTPTSSSQHHRVPLRHGMGQGMPWTLPLVSLTYIVN